MSEDFRTSLHDVATRFVERELDNRGAGVQPPLYVTTQQWSRMVQAGWPALLIPEAAGGHGLSLADLAAVTAAFAREGVGTPLPTVSAEVPVLLLTAGDTAQQTRWLSAIMDEGRILTTAVWELPHLFNLDSVTTEWSEDGDGYVLAGSKAPVAHAADADAFVVLARHATSGDLGLFVVARDNRGVIVDTLRTTTEDATGELVLQDAHVEAPARLCAGEPADAVRRAMDVGAVLASAELTVCAQRALELTLAYVRERTQFGQPIGAFQAVHHHCADMYRDIEGMRVICARLLQASLTDVLPTRDVSILKAKTSITARRVIERAHQLHGGVGFYRDYPLERLYRRSLVEQGAHGSSRWHRGRLAILLQDHPRDLQRSVHAV